MVCPFPDSSYRSDGIRQESDRRTEAQTLQDSNDDPMPFRSKEGPVADDSVQREIEANQSRKRDTEDVGLEEDVIVDRNQEGTIFDDLKERIFGDDDAPAEDSHEYRDNTKST